MCRRALPLLSFAACATAPQPAPEPTDAPAPLLPVPSERQLRWQSREVIAFPHFGVNTFTDREWGDGHESPQVFAPTALDARQWVRALKAGGVKLAILTAKHHDGFALWPRKQSDHSAL
jgi:alpha-L-fucosidase